MYSPKGILHIHILNIFWELDKSNNIVLISLKNTWHFEVNIIFI